MLHEWWGLLALGVIGAGGLAVLVWLAYWQFTGRGARARARRSFAEFFDMHFVARNPPLRPQDLRLFDVCAEAANLGLKNQLTRHDGPRWLALVDVQYETGHKFHEYTVFLAESQWLDVPVCKVLPASRTADLGPSPALGLPRLGVPAGPPEHLLYFIDDAFAVRAVPGLARLPLSPAGLYLEAVEHRLLLYCPGPCPATFEEYAALFELGLAATRTFERISH